MSKFKVGDRVRGFEGRFQVDGEVLNPNSDNDSSQTILLVKSTTGKEWYFNEKSCRKLVKKVRREFWIVRCDNVTHDIWQHEMPLETQPCCELIKVREVK